MHLFWHLVRGELAAAVSDHIGLGECRAQSPGHEQPDRFAGLLIRSPDTGTFPDAGTGCGDGFDLIWIDVEARDTVHVFLAIDDLVKPVCVDPANVSDAEVPIASSAVDA